MIPETNAAAEYIEYPCNILVMNRINYMNMAEIQRSLSQVRFILKVMWRIRDAFTVNYWMGVPKAGGGTIPGAFAYIREQNQKKKERKEKEKKEREAVVCAMAHVLQQAIFGGGGKRMRL